ncbi:MAG: VOC family protein [Erysipelotrichaceae bacterium]|nr:VOC family protein [Erysipelotrichaceae bacterium]
MKIHHIGYLVKKIDKAISAFQQLGYSLVTEKTYDSIRKINICFMLKDGYLIELVSPASDDSVVSGLIRQYRNAPYHFCYCSTDFDAALSALSANGYVCIDEPCPAPALAGKRVVFLMNPSIGLIELLEE